MKVVKDNTEAELKLPVDMGTLKAGLMLFGGLEGLKDKVRYILPYLKPLLENIYQQKRIQYKDKMEAGGYTSIGYMLLNMSSGKTGIVLVGSKFYKDPKEMPIISQPFEMMDLEGWLKNLIDSINLDEKDLANL